MSQSIRCNFTRQADGRWLCPVCGYKSKYAGDQMPRKQCGTRCSREHCPGVGDVFAVLVGPVGHVLKATGRKCQCKTRQRQMNQWGPAGCRERIGEIAGWFGILGMAARPLVLWACSRVEACHVSALRRLEAGTTK